MPKTTKKFEQRNIIIKDENCKVFTSDNGNYYNVKKFTVARVTYVDDKPFNWAAYYGHVSSDANEYEAAQLVGNYGDKLLAAEARKIVREAIWLNGKPPFPETLPYNT
jgi:hypothetical protein